jgi:hypothetical protein
MTDGKIVSQKVPKMGYFWATSRVTFYNIGKAIYNKVVPDRKKIMSQKITKRLLAGYKKFSPEVTEIVHQALLPHKDVGPELASNPTLSEEHWLQLYGTKKRCYVGVGSGLVSRKIPKNLRAHVIAKDKRITVFENLIRYNELDLDEQQLLSTNKEAVEALLRQPWFDDSNRHNAAMIASSTTLLTEMALCPLKTFTDIEVADHISNHAAWKTYSMRSDHMQYYLQTIFGRRPQVATKVIGQVENFILEAIAGSANLTSKDAITIAAKCLPTANQSYDFYRPRCLTALAFNPRTPLSVITDLATKVEEKDTLRNLKARGQREAINGLISSQTDPEVITWLLGKYCALDKNTSWHNASYLNGFGGNTYRAKSVELLGLYKNKHLTFDQRAKVSQSIIDGVDKRLWPKSLQPLEVPKKELVSYVYSYSLENDLLIDLAAKSLGINKEKWDVLVGLINEFSGTFTDLIKVAELL